MNIINRLLRELEIIKYYKLKCIKNSSDLDPKVRNNWHLQKLENIGVMPNKIIRLCKDSGVICFMGYSRKILFDTEEDGNKAIKIINQYLTERDY